LNIVANGMQGGLEQTVDQMDAKRCAETIKKYPDIIVGVKTAHYWTEEPWDGEHVPWAAVDKAEECGRAVNLPVMFDFWPRPDRSYAELILKKMRPGDIHTHVFAQQFPILLPDGKINPILAEARDMIGPVSYFGGYGYKTNGMMIEAVTRILAAREGVIAVLVVPDPRLPEAALVLSHLRAMSNVVVEALR